MDCVKRGICKVNFATELRAAYSKAVKETFAENENTIDPKAFTIIVESNEVVGEGFKEELPDIEL